MKVRLLCDVTTPEHWKSDREKAEEGVYFLKDQIVEVFPARNMPDDSPIKFWVDQGAAVNHPYGVAVREGEYEVMPG